MDNQLFWQAFSDAQRRFITPEKDGINTHIKNQYHKLETLLPPAMKAFSDNGILFYFEDINNQRDAGVRIHLRHLASNQHHSQTCLVDKEKLGAQATGGCYTYAKRYLLASLLLISDPKLDDDGEFATHGDRTQQTKNAPRPIDSKIIDNLKKQLAEVNVNDEEALKSVKAEDWNLTPKQIKILQAKIDVRRNKL